MREEIIRDLENVLTMVRSIKDNTEEKKTLFTAFHCEIEIEKIIDCIMVD